MKHFRSKNMFFYISLGTRTRTMMMTMMTGGMMEETILESSSSSIVIRDHSCQSSTSTAPANYTSSIMYVSLKDRSQVQQNLQ